MATEIVIETDGGEVVIPTNATSASHARNVLVTPQNGVVASNVQQALEDLAAGVGDGPGGGGAPTTATYVTTTPNGTLSNERVLTQGSGITLTENAVAGTRTVALGSHTHTADAITGGQIPAAVTFATADGDGFSNAVNTRLLDELPTDGGSLDIAQQSTLQAFINEFPVDNQGNLDIAQQATLIELGGDIDAIDTRVTALENAPDGVDLTGFSDGDVLMVEAGSGGNTLAAAVAGTDYIAPSDIERLRAVFAEATMPANAGTSTGYLKWTYDAGTSIGTWSVVTTAVEAPPFINGGGADADGA
jgi:hypothetical protein